MADAARNDASPASAHLQRLTTAHLIKVFVQGKHRYYSLNGPDVAHVLEGLNILAGGTRNKFAPNTPNRLCVARTCYDHLAGRVGVALHDRFRALGWLSQLSKNTSEYELTSAGTKAIEALGIDIEETRSLRRRFALACLDWSERRPHIGGALGAAAEIRSQKKVVDTRSRQQGSRNHRSRSARDAEPFWNESLTSCSLSPCWRK